MCVYRDSENGSVSYQRSPELVDYQFQCWEFIKIPEIYEFGNVQKFVRSNFLTICIFVCPMQCIAKVILYFYTLSNALDRV